VYSLSKAIDVAFYQKGDGRHVTDDRMYTCFSKEATGRDKEDKGNERQNVCLAIAYLLALRIYVTLVKNITCFEIIAGENVVDRPRSHGYSF